MASDLVVETTEFEDAYGTRLVVFKVVPRKEENVIKDIIIAGTELVIEALFLAYLWKFDFHVVWCSIVSVMGMVSFSDLCKNVEKYTGSLPHRVRLILKDSSMLILGAFSYFLTIYGISYELELNGIIWIPYLGFASYFFQGSISTVIELGETLSNRSLFRKCFQLLFGLMVIGCATCYLSFQHEETWILCLPLITPAPVVYKISAAEYRKFQGSLDIEPPVFHCISKMIGGPIFLALGCLGIIFTSNPVMLLVSLISAGIGLAVLGKSVLLLHDLVPQSLFERYCQLILGPVVTVYGSLVAAHVGYNIGWQSFVLMVPLISAGICLTYRGYRMKPQ